MITVDERVIHAPARVCFQVAADVERWPEILPHYRWVRFHQRLPRGGGLVEMAAWRPFLGPVRYPTWWVSRMEVDPQRPLVSYRHVDGITRRMDVSWEFHTLPVPPEDGFARTRVRITHVWAGPPWPAIGRLAARLVIGPLFISAIASRTLAGVAAEAERVAGHAGDATSAAVDEAIRRIRLAEGL